jgi:hypothetical protein
VECQRPAAFFAYPASVARRTRLCAAPREIQKKCGRNVEETWKKRGRNIEEEGFLSSFAVLLHLPLYERAYVRVRTGVRRTCACLRDSSCVRSVRSLCLYARGKGTAKDGQRVERRRLSSSTGRRADIQNLINVALSLMTFV